MTKAQVVRAVLAVVALVVIATFYSVRSSAMANDPATIAAQAPIPSGPEGDLIRYGRSLITDTPKYASQYVKAGMSCSACHLNGGTKPRGGSLLGVYAKFPQWNKRSKRFITLGDRLQECFLYSMNGTPPAPYSREIIAMTAYIAFLSRGAEVGKGFPNQGFVTIHAAKPDKTAGAKIYGTQCASCHGADGAGNASANFPPLWGAKSFNDGAGMNTKMAAFVKVNMPLNAPGSLTDQQAADVAAFVLSHSRPHFDPNRTISFPPKPAGFF